LLLLAGLAQPSGIISGSFSHNTGDSIHEHPAVLNYLPKITTSLLCVYLAAGLAKPSRITSSFSHTTVDTFMGILLYQCTIKLTISLLCLYLCCRPGQAQPHHWQLQPQHRDSIMGILLYRIEYLHDFTISMLCVYLAAGLAKPSRITGSFSHNTRDSILGILLDQCTFKLTISLTIIMLCSVPCCRPGQAQPHHRQFQPQRQAAGV
jgi:hypothetical protein